MAEAEAELAVQLPCWLAVRQYLLAGSSLGSLGNSLASTGVLRKGPNDAYLPASLPGYVLCSIVILSADRGRHTCDNWTAVRLLPTPTFLQTHGAV